MSKTTEQPSETEPMGGGTLIGQQLAASRLDFWIFVLLLVLALSGAAVSEATDSKGWVYWGLLVLIYGGISIGRTWFQLKDQSGRVWPMIRAEVWHWLATLITIKIILIFEIAGVTARGVAADFALLVLALSTFLAGVHFNWTYMLLGVILAVTALCLGFLDQYAVYLVTVPLALLAILIVFKHKFLKT